MTRNSKQRRPSKSARAKSAVTSKEVCGEIDCGPSFLHTLYGDDRTELKLRATIIVMKEVSEGCRYSFLHYFVKRIVREKFKTGTAEEHEVRLSLTLSIRYFKLTDKSTEHRQ